MWYNIYNKNKEPQNVVTGKDIIINISNELAEMLVFYLQIIMYKINANDNVVVRAKTVNNK